MFSTNVIKKAYISKALKRQQRGFFIFEEENVLGAFCRYKHSALYLRMQNISNEFQEFFVVSLKLKVCKKKSTTDLKLW